MAVSRIVGMRDAYFLPNAPVLAEFPFLQFFLMVTTDLGPERESEDQCRQDEVE